MVMSTIVEPGFPWRELGLEDVIDRNDPPAALVFGSTGKSAVVETSAEG